MQKRADFYILASGHPESIAIKLIDKAYQDGLKLLVMASDAAQAQQLDEALWHGQPTRFIPHAMMDDTTAPVQTPIYISTEATVGKPELNVCVNLSQQSPDLSHPWVRILEIVTNDPSSQQQARERFKQYRSSGFELHTHKLGG